MSQVDNLRLIFIDKRVLSPSVKVMQIGCMRRDTITGFRSRLAFVVTENIFKESFKNIPSISLAPNEMSMHIIFPSFLSVVH